MYVDEVVTTKLKVQDGEAKKKLLVQYMKDGKVSKSSFCITEPTAKVVVVGTETT